MSRFFSLFVASMMISTIGATTVAAQSRPASNSLTHVLSVTVPARVKVNVGSLPALSSRAVPAAVSLRDVSGLAVIVDANRPWVLAVSPAARSGKSPAPVVLTVSAP